VRNGGKEEGGMVVKRREEGIKWSDYQMEQRKQGGSTRWNPSGGQTK
jgi:hypothetical protein